MSAKITYPTTLPCRGDSLADLKAKYYQAKESPLKVTTGYGIITPANTNPDRADTNYDTWVKLLCIVNGNATPVVSAHESSLLLQDGSYLLLEDGGTLLL